MPYSERLETLKVLHLGHYAVDKMQLRALETVYWPGINKDILKYYQSCKTCIKYSKSQRNEPLQSHPTPVVPWHTVTTDLFETKNSKYLLIVDYYSRFPILHKLSSTTARVLIQEMKAVFAELHPSVSLRWRPTVYSNRVPRLHKTLANQKQTIISKEPTV